MQLENPQSSEDGLLDALLDHLTIDPSADLSSVLARVEQLRAAHNTGAKLKQRQTEQQQQHSADLRKKWADIIKTVPPDDRAVDALSSECTQYFLGLANSADHAMTRSAWRALRAVPPPVHAPGLATSTLLPLLSHLSQESSSSEGGSDVNIAAKQTLRRAYLLLLPSALRAAVPSASSTTEASRLSAQVVSETDAVAWYSQYTSSPVVRELLSPYLSVTVEPLEKELRYHFSAGRATAAIHEPQHFFSFLSECVERQQHTHRCTWMDAASSQAATAAQRPSPPPSILHLLDHLGQLSLSAAAVVTFQNCYGWRPQSQQWRCREYVVVTINAILDFVARTEGRLCREALELLLKHLLVEEVALCYAHAGVEMAKAALQNGTARMWRRSFLMHNTHSVQLPLYTCSLHMVRALEAFLRRLLSTLFVVESTYAALLWHKTVEPVLSHFLRVVEAQAVEALDSAEGENHHEGHGSWNTAWMLQWCVASVQVVATAAEDWLGMLRESVTVSSCSPASLEPTSDALDGLALFRDQLARRAAEQAKALTRQLCTHKPGDSAKAASLLHSLNVFLQQMEMLPVGPSRYVMQAVIQGVLLECLSREQQDGLAAFASRSGLSYVARLLPS
ncbi:hypothetical protein ABL78_5371 [Leptomonas seymouri]|uniref:Uncharacterized protein n=1 Tax=Leptomonas seymouri TaxID=5684 RepID=A0A0N1PDK4_LEPSE|nr:hypothetical protein ABL78_5371 [Leptomonas seymouri]|eukprot:KPI85564.1 hypothetical protein ABL78_5371 [Leptomonas seymouri]